MASTLSKFDRAGYKLNQAYAKGSICYPRVANNYITEIKFFEHPHPPLVPFDEYSTPLQHSEYPLIKELLALELTNENIATPATLFNNLKAGDKYFDADLKPRTAKIKDLKSKIDGFYDHIEDLVSNFGEGVLSKSGNPDVNRLSKDGMVSQFQMDITPFQIKLAPSPEREKKDKNEEKKKIRDDIRNLSPVVDEKKIKVNSLDEAHMLFKKKRLLMKRIKEKQELQQKVVARKI